PLARLSGNAYVVTNELCGLGPIAVLVHEFGDKRGGRCVHVLKQSDPLRVAASRQVVDEVEEAILFPRADTVAREVGLEFWSKLGVIPDLFRPPGDEALAAKVLQCVDDSRVVRDRVQSAG